MRFHIAANAASGDDEPTLLQFHFDLACAVGFSVLEKDIHNRRILDEQDFYITEAGKLVISFDVYEIAPGFMGLVTVEIPSELLQDVLMSNKYIK